MSSHVLLVGGAAEFDQFTPIAWALSSDGESVHLLIDRTLLGIGNPCEGFLRALPGVHVHPVRMPSSRWGQFAWNSFRARRLLARLDAGLLGVEWGNGIAGRSQSRSFIKRAKDVFAATPALQLQLAAHARGIPVVSLPHGHSTKTSLVPSAHVREVAASHGGKLPFADRDSYAAYVFCSDYHRRVIVENSTMSGDNAQVWGSTRFSREWVEKLYSLSSPADIDSGLRRRVLVFLPKWHNSIDRAATLDLLRALGREPQLHVAVAGHLRAKDSTLSEAEIDELSRLDSLDFVGASWTSTQLISWCEVLIDVDSSIAFDALRLGRLYVRPKYLQSDEVTTIYDELGGALQARDQADVIDIVTAATLEPAPMNASFWSVVAGDGPQAVGARYAQNLRQLRKG